MGWFQSWEFCPNQKLSRTKFSKKIPCRIHFILLWKMYPTLGQIFLEFCPRIKLMYLKFLSIKLYVACRSYHTAQNLTGENIDEFPAIRQYFPYQNFPFSTTDEFVAIRLHSKSNYISEVPSLENHNIQSSLSHYTTILTVMH